MAVNKVVYGDKTLVDLTNDSVTPDTLAEGATAHDASGAQITGTMKSGGGASVQSDWNQTDETAADFIKNKPFGEVPTVILEEQELVYDENEGVCFAETSAPIHPGDLLTIVYDGNRYEVEAVDLEGSAVFGNLDFFGGSGGNGEPFAGMYMDGLLVIVPVDGTSHIVQIVIADISKLPAKYYDRYSVMYARDGYIYTDSTYTTKATEDYVKNLIMKSPAAVMQNAVEYFFFGQVMSVMSNSVIGKGNKKGLCVMYSYLNSFLEAYTAEYTPTT